MKQLIGFIAMYFKFNGWPSSWYIVKRKTVHGWPYITSVLLIWSVCLAIPIWDIVYNARHSDARFIKLFPLFIWLSYFSSSSSFNKCFTTIDNSGTQLDSRFLFYQGYDPGSFIAIIKKMKKEIEQYRK